MHRLTKAHTMLPCVCCETKLALSAPIHKVSFRRKVDELAVVEPIAGEMEIGGAHRPAQLYRLRKEFRHALSVVDRGLNSRG